MNNPRWNQVVVRLDTSNLVLPITAWEPHLGPNLGCVLTKCRAQYLMDLNTLIMDPIQIEYYNIIFNPIKPIQRSEWLLFPYVTILSWMLHRLLPMKLKKIIHTCNYIWVWLWNEPDLDSTLELDPVKFLGLEHNNPSIHDHSTVKNLFHWIIHML